MSTAKIETIFFNKIILFSWAMLARSHSVASCVHQARMVKLTILQSSPRIAAVWAISISCYSCNTAVVACEGVKTSHEDTLGKYWDSLLQGVSHMVVRWTVDVVVQDGTIPQILTRRVPWKYHWHRTGSIEGDVFWESCVYMPRASS